MVYTEEQQQRHVRELQRNLRTIASKDERIPSVGIDGIYGPETTAAVSAFQTVYGLPVTGTTDRATWDRIVSVYREVLAAEGRPAFIEPFPSAEYVILPGESGSLIYILQIMLNTLSNVYRNFTTLPINGVYNDQTQEEIKKFQTVIRHPATGRVDKTTWDMLASAYNTRLT